MTTITDRLFLLWSDLHEDGDNALGEEYKVTSNAATCGDAGWAHAGLGDNGPARSSGEAARSRWLVCASQSTSFHSHSCAIQCCIMRHTELHSNAVT